MQLQLRARHDHRTARKIDPLSKQVLTETALFAFQHVRQRFQRPLIGTSDHAAAAAIVEQRIHRFLQHPLFVAHDNIGRAQFDQSLQTVVAVNHTAIKIVQIRRCKPAAIQWHQGAQLRRNHRHNSEDHPFRAVARFQKAFNHFQALDDFFRLQLTRGFFEIRAQLLGFRFQIDRRQHFADRFCTDIGGKCIHTERVLRVHIFFFGHHLTIGQIGQTRLDHHIIFKIQHAFQITKRHIQHQANPRWQRL